MHGLRRVARALGYELVPLRKARQPEIRLVAALRRAGIDAVVDVGANAGQYALRLREAGWSGPILSIEPLAELRDRLASRAARDPAWQVAPAMALGRTAGSATLEVSSESDMSSLQAQTPLLERLSPSSRIVERRLVPIQRLDGLEMLVRSPWQRLFVKLDVQGAEPQVLAGAEGLWPRIRGLQVEMALLPLYEGETDWRSMVDDLAGRGYEPHLLVPGYFEPRLAREVQVDGVFFRKEPMEKATAEGGVDGGA
jgi:FkbM family methyltransferase